MLQRASLQPPHTQMPFDGAPPLTHVAHTPRHAIRTPSPHAIPLGTKDKARYVPFSAIIFLSLRRIAEGKRNMLNYIYKV